MPFTDALADMHKIAHREYRMVRVLNIGVYLSLIVALGLFFYLAMSPHSPMWVIVATALLMVTVVATAYRGVWFGTYDRFLKTMAIRRPDSVYSTVFRARAER